MYFLGRTMVPEEAIRIRSYEIWQREGRPDGKAMEHWLTARMELEAEFRVRVPYAGQWRSNVMPRLPATRPPARTVSRRVSAIAARG